MATHATIWQKKPDGWRGVYLNYDGYPENAGKALAECYNTDEKLDALLEPVFSGNKYLNTLKNTPAECEYKTDSDGLGSWTGVQTAGERQARSNEQMCEYQYESDGAGWKTVALSPPPLYFAPPPPARYF